MTPENPGGNEVDDFIRRHIDTVPHLEALLLLWHSRPEARSTAQMANELFVDAGRAEAVLEDLAALGFVERLNGYRYSASAERDRLMASLDTVYRRELVRVTRMIHSKGSQAARAFSRAFRFAPESERR